jgi:hypothetical protein
MLVWAADGLPSWVEVSSASLQIVQPRGMVMGTEFNEGKIKFSQVLFIQKRSKIGTASRVTSDMVLPDRSSKGIHSLSHSRHGLRADWQKP